MAGVRYSPKALDDIERIRDYIRDALLNPEAATKFISDVFAAGDCLAEKSRPGACFRSDREILSYYRYLMVGRYLLVYRVQNDEALVVRVLHELQDTLSILLADDAEAFTG